MKRELEGRQVGWGFWLKWVLVSTLGIPVGFVAAIVFNIARLNVYQPVFEAVLGTTIFDDGSDYISEMFWGVIVSVAIVGAVIGVFQWLVLRREVSRAGWWIVANAVGWPLGWVISKGVFEPGFEMASGMTLDPRRLDYDPVIGSVVGVMSWAVMGAVAGGLQWLVLRGKVSLAGSWILASMVSLPVGVIAVGGAEMLVYEFDPRGLMGAVVVAVFALVGGAVSAALPGCITGGVLVWLLRLHRPDQAGAIEINSGGRKQMPGKRLIG